MGHFIKPDLADTITRFEYEISTEKMEIPWGEIVSSIDPEESRESSQLHGRGCRKNDRKDSLDIGENNSKQAIEISDSSQKDFSENRKRMLSGMKMINGTKIGRKSQSTYFMGLHPNFDEKTAEIVLSKLQGIIPQPYIEDAGEAGLKFYLSYSEK